MALRLDFSTHNVVDPYKGLSEALGSSGGLAKYLMARDGEKARQAEAEQRKKEMSDKLAFQARQSELQRQQAMKIHEDNIALRGAEINTRLLNQDEQTKMAREKLAMLKRADERAAEAQDNSLLEMSAYATTAFDPTETVTTQTPVIGPDGKPVYEANDLQHPTQETIAALQEYGTKAKQEQMAIDQEAQKLRLRYDSATGKYTPVLPEGGWFTTDSYLKGQYRRQHNGMTYEQAQKEAQRLNAALSTLGSKYANEQLVRDERIGHQKFDVKTTDRIKSDAEIRKEAAETFKQKVEEFKQRYKRPPTRSEQSALMSGIFKSASQAQTNAQAIQKQRSDMRKQAETLRAELVKIAARGKVDQQTEALKAKLKKQLKAIEYDLKDRNAQRRFNRED